MESVCTAAKVSVHTGWVVALLSVLLVLSSAVTRTEAGRHYWGRRDDASTATAAAMATTPATATVTVRGHFTKVDREEMEIEMDDAVVGLGESKRRSPGGPDPQHH